MPLPTEIEMLDELLSAAVDAGRGQGVRLPDVGPPGAALSSALETRRAVRQYSDGPVSEPALREILNGVGTTDAAGVHRAVALSGHQDQDAGVYPISEGCLGARIAGEATVRALREQYAPAPVLLIYYAVPETIADYYRLLMSAGTAGYLTWLAAVALGLVGCPFGRGSGDVVRALRAADQSSAKHLFTLALGRPAHTEATST